MDYQMIAFAVQDRVARLTLNRPDRLNALTIQMGVELLDALERCEADDEVRCVVLSGAGRSFCAGDDLRGLETPGFPHRRGPDETKQYVHGWGRWTQVVFALRRLPKPTIAMVRGHAWGGGLNLALACDLRVCAESATFCAPFVRWGMATGTNLLPYFIGLGLALEMTLLGDPIDAARAERLGLANRLVPDEQLEEATMELARRLAAGPTRALGLTKAAVYKGWWRDPEVAYDYQGYAQTLVRLTEDWAEGRQAFLEKRPPRYTGR